MLTLLRTNLDGTLKENRARKFIIRIDDYSLLEAFSDILNQTEYRTRSNHKWKEDTSYLDNVKNKLYNEYPEKFLIIQLSPIKKKPIVYFSKWDQFPHFSNISEIDIYNLVSIIEDIYLHGYFGEYFKYSLTNQMRDLVNIRNRTEEQDRRLQQIQRICREQYPEILGGYSLYA